MSIPIVFIHKGNSSYLFDTFYQLKRYNNDVPAYLIGTKESHVYKGLVKNVDIAAYFAEAEQFKKVYKHFSTNSYEFELICLQRWFVLKDFLIKNNINRCLYLDSDVLIYNNVNELAKRYTGYGMTICGISGHTNFLEINTLIEFCNYVTTCYTDNGALKQLEEYFINYKAKQLLGGISDMTFLHRFSLNYPNKVLNLYDDKIGKDAFDPSMENGEDRYQMDGKIKKVEMKDGKPYCFRLSDGAPVLHNTLHFQGATSKKRMTEFISCTSAKYYTNHTYYQLLYKTQKLFKKLGVYK